VIEAVQQERVERAVHHSHARPRTRRFVHVALALIIIVWAGVTVMSMRNTSATFDEILLSSAGARGYATGDYDLIVLYHPRLMQYMYGLPVALSGVSYPEERGQFANRGGFPYARQLFFERGNDARTLLFRTRLVAVLVGASLILLVFAFTRHHYGDAAAIFAALMMAAMPDLIAHGGIAYNDVGIGLAVLGSVWTLDRAARDPAARPVALAAVVAGLALSVKYSAVALAPIAVCLIALEAVARGREWRRYLLAIVPLALLAFVLGYLTLVAVYLGDFSLSSYRAGLQFNIMHASAGHGGMPAVLLGETSPTGFRFYFPLAFLIKTPAAFHILLAVALLGFATSWSARARELLRSPLRGPVVALLVFTAFLLNSKLNIGFRHAFPALPLLAVIAAAGLGALWQRRARLRPVIGGLLVVQWASVLSWYPHFIPYTSEYFPDRDLAFTRLGDSNVDWGQALPLLRRFMDEEGVPVVYLSYFGSALPEAYGIDYVPLRSFFDLPPRSAPAEEPRFVAISATNLAGSYVDNQFRTLLHADPYRVLGHSMFIYRIGD
jgi:4-amino-4-deoxy-L-arabinose transferase-like glycosyltransferase